MHSMGYRSMVETDVEKMIAEVDLNDNKQVEWNEFLIMMKNFYKAGKETGFTKMISKSGLNFFRVGNDSSNSFSTFSEDERSAFVRVINQFLSQDEVCKKYLPINPDTMELFAVLKNGILLCKLINKAAPGTIDERVINTKDNMNVFQIAVIDKSFTLGKFEASFECSKSYRYSSS